MNFAKFLRTPFLQNKSERLLFDDYENLPALQSSTIVSPLWTVIAEVTYDHLRKFRLSNKIIDGVQTSKQGEEGVGDLY